MAGTFTETEQHAVSELNKIFSDKQSGCFVQTDTNGITIGVFGEEKYKTSIVNALEKLGGTEIKSQWDFVETLMSKTELHYHVKGNYIEANYALAVKSAELKADIPNTALLKAGNIIMHAAQKSAGNLAWNIEKQNTELKFDDKNKTLMVKLLRNGNISTEFAHLGIIDKSANITELDENGKEIPVKRKETASFTWNTTDKAYVLDTKAIKAARDAGLNYDKMPEFEGKQELINYLKTINAAEKLTHNITNENSRSEFKKDTNQLIFLLPENEIQTTLQAMKIISKIDDPNVFMHEQNKIIVSDDQAIKSLFPIISDLYSTGKFNIKTEGKMVSTLSGYQDLSNFVKTIPTRLEEASKTSVIASVNELTA